MVGPFSGIAAKLGGRFLGVAPSVSLNTIFWIAGSLGEAVVIALLLYRRFWRTFPVFLIYSIWSIVGSVAAYVILYRFSSAYVTDYIVEKIVDSTLMFGVLVELGWSVLRPLRASLPRYTLPVVAGLILALGAAIWFIAGVPAAAKVSHGVLGHLQQTSSVLSVLIFLGLAGGSQLLSIGWQDRELQIATGLGFYSLVSLVVAVLQAHQTTWSQYTNWNELVVASSLCSLLYWVVSFSRKEAERRQFTPQMQSFLLAMAGAARSTRMALEDSSPPKRRNQKPM
jgi:hypothetical protein